MQTNVSFCNFTFSGQYGYTERSVLLPLLHVYNFLFLFLVSGDFQKFWWRRFSITAFIKMLAKDLLLKAIA